jgi:hypothetical protein
LEDEEVSSNFNVVLSRLHLLFTEKKSLRLKKALEAMEKSTAVESILKILSEMSVKGNEHITNLVEVGLDLNQFNMDVIEFQNDLHKQLRKVMKGLWDLTIYGIDAKLLDFDKLKNYKEG